MIASVLLAFLCAVIRAIGFAFFAQYLRPSERFISGQSVLLWALAYLVIFWILSFDDLVVLQKVLLMGAVVLGGILTQYDVNFLRLPSILLGIFVALSLVWFLFIPDTLPEFLWRGAFCGVLGGMVLLQRWRQKILLGEGDVVLLACGQFWTPFYYVPLFFICIGTLGIIFALLWRQRHAAVYFPMAPAILGGLVLTHLLMRTVGCTWFL